MQKAACEDWYTGRHQRHEFSCNFWPQRMYQSALRSAAGGRNDPSKISLAFGIVDLKA
jgi:hypothetical protein